jgi:probable F420-dependent oxidoreductase
VRFAWGPAATRIELVTGILILPQRQTALVAKQAATLDVLSSGRLRLGVGLGWNRVEYAALGENFHNRGKRIEEQVDLLRRLWTEPLVVYKGKWHEVQDAGIKPLPVQRPIPIWFGGTARAAIMRIARIADGWLVNIRDPQEARPNLELLFAELDRLSRDRAKFGIEARIHHAGQGPEEWEKTLAVWQSMGATHASFNTMNSGLDGAERHLDALRQFAAVVRQM